MSDQLTPTAVITCHVNADFDSIAAMVAAKKLYPEAVILAPKFLPRKSNSPFYLNLAETFAFYTPKYIVFDNVTLLIVVDTRNPKRLEHVQELLNKPNIQIHAYDHHPDRVDDIATTQSNVSVIGSTTSLLLGLIQQQNISLTSQEATLFALGIYEDTGSFKHNSTTKEDFIAASYLVQFGIDFSVIKSLTSELTGDQIHLLNILLRNATTHNIHGVQVTVAEITLDTYQDDFSAVVEKLMVMENLTCIVALAVMADRVHIIARTTLQNLNIGKLCETFGGGGHAAAASAVVKNMPLAEIKAKVLAMLVAEVTPFSTAGRYMTSPAKVVASSESIYSALEMMNRYGLKAVPVIDVQTNHCIGIIEQQTAAKALSHKLGHLFVAEYTQRKFSTLTQDSPLPLAVSIILQDQQRLIPIIENDKVIGVITRTDIIKLLIEEPLRIPEGTPLGQNKSNRNVADRLADQLSKDQLELIQHVGKLADKEHIAAYIVGGFVRDLTLKRPNTDFDISVETDAIAFSYKVAEFLNGTVRSHEIFKTATVLYTDKFGKEQHLDIATSRLEFYEYPAAMPTVELSSIKMDLFRRDFTMNAMAIQLNEKEFGNLIDPFGAQRDINDKIIAVLHSLSFIEDPTRILRAVRFEQRFNFRIGAQTERLIKNALKLGMIEKLTGGRILNELKAMFEETDPPACLQRLDSWKILEQIHKILRITPQKAELLTNIQEVINWYKKLHLEPSIEPWRIYFMGLCGNAKYEEVSTVLDRLGLVDSIRKDFLAQRIAIVQTSEKAIKLAQQEPKNSDWYNLFYALPTEGVLFLMAKHGAEHGLEKSISHYLTQLRDVTLKITGNDLIALGEKPGPVFGDTLRHVLYSYLNGNVQSKKEQLDLANDYLMSVSTETAQQTALTQLLNGRT